MNCQNGGTCALINTNNPTCLCPQGWTGVLCQKCTSNLVCSNGFCDPIQGTCNCAFSNCTATFVSCIAVNNCVNGAGCSLLDGTCQCPSGYSGQYCELSMCAEVFSISDIVILNFRSSCKFYFYCFNEK